VKPHDDVPSVDTENHAKWRVSEQTNCAPHDTVRVISEAALTAKCEYWTDTDKNKQHCTGNLKFNKPKQPVIQNQNKNIPGSVAL